MSARTDRIARVMSDARDTIRNATDALTYTSDGTTGIEFGDGTEVRDQVDAAIGWLKASVAELEAIKKTVAK